MKAEALLGTALGNCMMQQMIGQGGMGAVYLAQQERPRRQVAVKVLMPASGLKPYQLSAFLERFRRETNAVSSLEHPNIVPVYEYGEHNGLPYLVMPYISAGTLRDVMDREGQMNFTNAVSYIEQMAAALDFAHARGVIHRDIKPANMLLAPDGRLVLTDFGLVKVLSDQQTGQVQLTGVGAPVGTPDYMSPEQVIGGEVDGRSDQYSLGVVLFQMLTGATPFRGEMPMQIASQHLHTQPPAPRSLRPDLPETAERVLLRAMAKQPGERFNSAQEFAAAFRAALSEQQRMSSLGTAAIGGGLLSGATTRKKGGLFDAKWQAGDAGAPPAGTGLLSKNGLLSRAGMNNPTGMLANSAGDQAYPTMTTGPFATDQTASETLQRPAFGSFQDNPNMQPSFGSLASGNFQAGSPAQHPPFGQSTFSNFQADTTGQQTYAGFPTNGAGPAGGLQSSFFAPPTGGLAQSSPTGNLQQMSPSFQNPTGTFQQSFPTGNLQQMSPSGQSPTTALALLSAQPQGGGNTVKLTEAVKVVQVPVGGGQYVTGYLPMQRITTELPAEQPRKPISPMRKVMLVAALCVLLLGGIGGVIALNHAHSGSPTPTAGNNLPDRTATAAVQASETAQANILFDDSLSQNIHNFPAPNAQQFFQNGAYHLFVPGTKNTIQLVEQKFLEPSLSYGITMEEIKGDDNSAVNSFGVILNCNVQNINALVITTFYTFEILNWNGHYAYKFFKYNSNYDSSKQSTPWTALGTLNAPGKEFHGGQGSNAVNAVRVVDNAGSFTFYVNGQQVGTASDTSLQPGYLGMMVNHTGTEVAYTNMLVTLK